MPAIAVLAAARSPWGRLLGSLGDLRPESLGAAVLRGALDRSGVAPGAVGRAFLGNVAAHDLRGNPAAAALREAGVDLPAGTVATTRAGCASGLSSILLAADALAAGSCEVTVCGGFESSSNAHHLLAGVRRGFRLGGGILLDGARHDGPAARATGGEEDFAAFHEGFERATAAGIVPVGVPGPKGALRMVGRDEALEGPDRSPPGAAPPLADGAAVLVLAGAAWAETNGLKPLARLSAADPFAAAGTVRRIEADLAGEEAGAIASRLDGGRKILNACGGGALLGHAAGADGARLVVDLIHALRGAGGGRGLAVALGAWGERAAVVVET